MTQNNSKEYQMNFKTKNKIINNLINKLLIIGLITDQILCLKFLIHFHLKTKAFLHHKITNPMKNQNLTL